MTDQRLERMIATLLRSGVLIAGAVVLAGGLFYVAAHGGEAADYHQFGSQPAANRLPHKIIEGAVARQPGSIIQLGVLLLVATPILRVGLALVGFALERDRQYLIITAIVLAILLFSLVSGAAGG